jgi:tRNA U34 5-methylaminomethyl-2-thiouridine-forming methyltransferase MnmC
VYSLVTTKDGSNTLYSKEYKQHYHNIDDGAVFETLSKHVIPAFTFHKQKDQVNILDICFGLGYNTLGTIYYIKNNNINSKINVYSPELDKKLINSLENFIYPKEFHTLVPIIKQLCKDFYYKDEQFEITLYIGDAKNYLKNLDIKFDIIYQDAFSSDVNYELWTKEYFQLLYNLSKEDTIITTYSIATPVRLSMYEAGFKIYEYIPLKRKQTLAFISYQNVLGKYIDMQLKKINNPKAKALYDR